MFTDETKTKYFEYTNEKFNQDRDIFFPKILCYFDE